MTIIDKDKVKIENASTPADEKLKEMGVAAKPEIKAESSPLQPGYVEEEKPEKEEKDMPGVPGVKEETHEEPDGDEPDVKEEESWYCSKCGTKHVGSKMAEEEEEDEEPKEEPVKKMDEVVPPLPATPQNYVKSTRLSMFGYDEVPPQKMNARSEAYNTIIANMAEKLMGNTNQKQ